MTYSKNILQMKMTRLYKCVAQVHYVLCIMFFIFISDIVFFCVCLMRDVSLIIGRFV